MGVHLPGVVGRRGGRWCVEGCGLGVEPPRRVAAMSTCSDIRCPRPVAIPHKQRTQSWRSTCELDRAPCSACCAPFHLLLLLHPVSHWRGHPRPPTHRLARRLEHQQRVLILEPRGAITRGAPARAARAGQQCPACG